MLRSRRSHREARLIVIQPVGSQALTVLRSQASLEVRGDCHDVLLESNFPTLMLEIGEELFEGLLDDAGLGLARESGSLSRQLVDVLVLDVETHPLHLSTLQRCHSTIVPR